jgi:ketosteroid isomerase-like protein
LIGREACFSQYTALGLRCSFGVRFCNPKGEILRVYRFAGWALTAALMFSITPVTVSASPSSDAINTVKLAINAMNKGNMDAFVALCDSPVVVIDTFDPYLMGGATGCTDWWNARVAYNKTAQLTDATAGIGAPWHVFVTGDNAYVDAPLDYHYNQKGATMRETGSVLTVTLKKEASGWRITSWAHTKHLEG